MKVMFCDICGREMTQHEAGAISRAALTDLAGAENVCKRCADAAAKIDWREAVGGRSAEEMSQAMCPDVPWAEGLPLRADGYEGMYYYKD